MELVYLWVEDYKNIQKQGFNFSPRFECSYENGELDIKDKEETGEPYLKDFFGKNINVTAIVGENGSGKSSIQKIIFMLIYFNTYKSLNKDSKDINSMNKYLAKENIRQYHGGKAYLIIHIDREFFILTIERASYSDKMLIEETKNGDKIIPINCNYILKSIRDINFFNVHFNYMIDTWVDSKVADAWVQTIYHRSDGYETPVLLEPYKGHKRQLIDIDNIEYLNIQKILKYSKNLKKNEIITSFFTPNQIKYTYSRILRENENYEYKLIDKFHRLEIKHVIYTKRDSDRFVGLINKLYEDNNISMINKLYISFKSIELGNTDSELFDNAIYNKLEKLFIDQKINFFLDYIKELDFNKFLKKINYYKTLKIEKCVEFANRITEIKQSFLENKNQIVDVNTINFVDILPTWLEIELYQRIDKINRITLKTQKTYHSLSSGEKQIFMQIINILYQVNNITSEQNRYNTINIFLDETEYGLHPNWQKKYVQFFIESLKEINIKINLFFASHSPFILSDLTKQNVIFLEKYKEEDSEVKDKIQKIGNCKNSTKDVDINPFGANIHTLLSHGFFMKDGLMGEFAKGKINEVYSFLSDDNYNGDMTREKAEQIINIIGEPVLQKELQKLFDKNIDIDEQIKAHEDEIARLKAKKEQP